MGDQPLDRDPGLRDLARLRRKTTMELAETFVVAGLTPEKSSSASAKAPRMANYKWLLGLNNGFAKVLNDGLVRCFVDKPLLRLQANQTRHLVYMWCPRRGDRAPPFVFEKTKRQARWTCRPSSHGSCCRAYIRVATLARSATSV